MSRTATACLRAVALAVFAAPAAAQAPAAKSTPSADELAEWVRQLDADEFLARETAMLQLLDAGPAAITALKPVLSGGSLEATSRALHLLRQLGLAADFDTQEQAWAMLAELADRKESPSLARRAAAMLEELAQRRAAQALAELEALGAKVVRSQFFGGLPLDESAQSIELGDDFRGTAADLRRLKWLRDAPVVVLVGDKAGDEWIGHVAEMQRLEELHLYRARVSDAGLAALAGHANLQQVGIYYTPIGDAALAPLAKLPRLSGIKLYGTQVTLQGKDEFAAASGIARPDYRRGAFLGVGCSAIDPNCTISNVHEGSPAATAGLMPEDVIVRFGQAKVTNFESLQDLIRTHAPDEEVELEVIRRSFDEQGIPRLKNVVTNVKFAPWELGLAVSNRAR